MVTHTTDVTTRSSTEENVGTLSEMFEKTSVISTTHTVTELDAMSGAILSSTREEHTTKEVRYLRRTGYGLEVLKTHGLETLSNYVETYRVLTQIDATYEPAGTGLSSCDDDCDGFGFECAQGHDGSKRCLSSSACGGNSLTYGTSTEGEVICGPRSTRMSTTTVYQHTDNPLTRNNLSAYKSTTQTVRETWSDDDWTYEGVEWLTDEIEIDPDYDAVWYSLNSDATTVTSHTTRFLGSDLAATEMHDRTDHEVETAATWDQDVVSVSGSHAVTSASLTNGALSETLASNADGTYAVESNGASVSMGAEEWIDSVAP